MTSVLSYDKQKKWPFERGKMMFTQLKRLALLHSLFVILLMGSACTTLFTGPAKKEEYQLKETIKQTYCSNIGHSSHKMGHTNYAHNSPSLNEGIEKFFQSPLVRGQGLTPIEKAIIISLLQMNARPDLVAPSSRLQVLINNNGQQRYFDFWSTDKDSSKNFPYLVGLNYLLKEYKSTRSLISLAALIDQYYTTPFIVEDSFKEFLQKNKEKIRQNSALVSLYFREVEILNKNEILPRIHFTSFLKNFPIASQRTSPHLHISTILQKESNRFYMNKGPHLEILCNTDFSSYKQNIYFIRPQALKSLNFGLEQDHFSFLASSTQVIDDSGTSLKTFHNGPVFIGASDQSPSTLCFIKHPQFELSLISTDDRDPGQHMDHFLNKNILQIKSIDDLDTFFRESRYLFLANPARLVVESERTSQNQLENIMKLNFPIYHAQTLAEFWGHLYLSKEEHGLVIDDRNHSALACPRKE